MDPIKETIERMHQDPGLPSNNPTTAFWQEPAHPTLKDIQSPVLPTSVDVAIIGSGITGCSVANTLLSGNEDLKVIMLEARTATSGATGRNGGHIKEMPFYEYSELAEQHGKEAAQRLIRFRLSHLYALMSFAKQLGQEAVTNSEIRIVETVDAVFDEAQWQHIKALLRNFLDDFPEEVGKWHAYEKEEAIAGYGIPTAVGVITGLAGALWPYRLITEALEGLLSSHKQRFSLETHTPVLSISTEGSESFQYQVITNRGTIRARHVVHCTNGYVGHLLPNLRGTIFPMRGQMTVQNPGQSFPTNGARQSWGFVYKRGFDYMTQSAVSNDIYLGGGFANGENKGLDDLGVSSDEQLSLLALAHLNGLLPTLYGPENWGLDAAHQPRVKAAWSGIMGFSSDGMPWVGKLPDELSGRHAHPGGSEWIAAAFCGEGMVHCWQSGRALGEMILGNESAIAEWFPRLLYPTVERLQRARVEDFIARTI
ncbi:FAD dependent oxidoreductase [Talaromyces proteolyticus]|uniref:FAD dependent oxidoreductase n=1 Tax=Talaromyces proteolyticus TaxID=1131652 RepID=A0AAD4L1D3_9EURO|nr:FAD dependent oxidoreductase [Talaromyces proteolyticus]KAH8705768.1 FAD dependent oxidoreductase [Talaromyces proteolyticus]